IARAGGEGQPCPCPFRARALPDADAFIPSFRICRLPRDDGLARGVRKGRSLCSRRCAVAPSAPAFTHTASEAGEGGMLQIQKLVIHFTKALQPVLRAVEARDAKLADQLWRSVLSVGLNLGEGYGASGGGKRRAYRIALGEATELQMGLEMAAALGYCALGVDQRRTLGWIIGGLHKLARPQR